MPAQGQRQHGHCDEQRRGSGAITKNTVQDGEGDQRAQVERVVRRQHQRVGLDPAGQLEEGDDRPGEGDRADEDADDDLGGVDAEQVAADLGLPRRRLDATGSRSSRPAPRPGRRSCAASRSARACRSSRPGGPATGRSLAPMTMATTSRVRPIAEMLRVASADGRGQRDGHAGDAEGVAGLRGLVLGQPGEAEDEQQGGDDVGGRDGTSMAVIGALEPFRVNIRSIRRVTAKPPNTLMLASRIATEASAVTTGCVVADLQQRADHDDPGDRVGHAHQRGVQRVVHVADHVEADDHRQGEHGEVAESARSGRTPATQEQQRGADADQREPARRRWRRLGRRPARPAAAGAGGRCGRHLHRRRGPGLLAVPHDGHRRAGRRRRSRGPASPSLPGVSSVSRLTRFGAVELRGLGGQPAGQVGVADDRARRSG